MPLTKDNLASNLTSMVLFFVPLALFAVYRGHLLIVAAPLVLTGVAFRYFFIRIYRLEGTQAFANLGVFYALVVAIYVSFPLIGYLIRELGYGHGNNNRLLYLNPSPEQVAWVGGYGVVYIVCFMFAYVATSRQAKPFSRVILGQRPPLHAVLVTFLLATGFVLALGFYLDLGSRSYLDRFLAIWSLPLVIRQIANHISGISVIAVIALLTFWIADYGKHKFLVISLLLYELIATVVMLGGRSEVIQYLIAAGLLYHLFIKELSEKIVLIIVTFGLIAMLGYGVVRSTVPYGGEARFGVNLLTDSNEFESLFATTLELQILDGRNQIPAIPWQMSLSGFTSLIPQQFLPFEKMDYANWYLDTFHPAYKGMGGGLAFGTLAEAVVGFGLPELILRALLLGWIFARIHRWYLERRDNFWVTCFYLWLIVESYQCFRSSMFIIVTYAVYRFLPYYLCVVMFQRVIRRVGHGRNQTLPINRFNS